MKRLLVTGLAAGAFFGMVKGGGGGTGVEWRDGESVVWATTNIVDLFAAGLAALSYYVAVDPVPAQPRKTGNGSMTRRGLSWFIDLFMCLIAVTPSVAVLALAVEWARTGALEWSFARPNPSTLDVILSFSWVGVMFAALAFYWVIPVRLGGQTVGQAMLDLRTVRTDGDPADVRRLFLRGLLRCFAPLFWIPTVFGAPYLPDEFSRTKVVRVTPP
jgi:uncharacterized RDD family membrane protein YckC